jgi:heme/copper-type cytochrome/quinol oxidase subunit 1
MLVLRRYGLLFLGLLLLLVGGIVLVVGVAQYNAEPAGFGWTAYAPLESGDAYVPRSVPSAMSQIVAGVVVMLLGLGAAAVWLVLWLRRGRTE